jgi:hypothetical protein
MGKKQKNLLSQKQAKTAPKTPSIYDQMIKKGVVYRLDNALAISQNVWLYTTKKERLVWVQK